MCFNFSGLTLNIYYMHTPWVNGTGSTYHIPLEIPRRVAEYVLFCAAKAMYALLLVSKRNLHYRKENE